MKRLPDQMRGRWVWWIHRRIARLGVVYQSGEATSRQHMQAHSPSAAKMGAGI